MNRNIFFFLFIIVFIFLYNKSLCAENWFNVKSVIDGDTIILSDGRHIRYIGINAPEVEHNEQKAQPYGEAAKQFNKNMVFSEKVHLEFDKDRFDQYGRLLAYIFLKDGSLINAKIIAQGYAYFLGRSPNKKYDSLLLQCQRRAMSGHKGIWSRWREKKDRYLGNQHSKRFHLIKCSYGRQTSKKSRIFFSSKWDAFWEGYAPCKKCLPEYFIPQSVE
ncbi:MAG: thermonuclease family protein [Desulfobacterales bacterium]|nr:thermonuclease family protein [Desulfobacterales bacterium]